MVGRVTTRNSSRGATGSTRGGTGSTRGTTGSTRGTSNRGRNPTSHSSQDQGEASGSIVDNINNSPGHSCGLCNSTVGDDAIGCDVCPNWYHPSPQCTGLRSAATDCILKDGDSGILFKCSSCRCSNTSSSSGNTSGTTSELNTALIQVFEIVKSLAVNVA